MKFILRVAVPGVFVFTYFMWRPIGKWNFVDLVFIVSISVFAIYSYVKWSARCPSCKRWGTAQKIKSDFLDFKERPTRHFSETKIEKDFSGKNIQITRNYKEDSSTTKYLDRFLCSSCEHEWEVERNEDNNVKTEI
jgi:hypothetical protein